MQTLSAADLLDAWESAAAYPSDERPLRLLQAAGGRSPEELDALTMGQREVQLLNLRERTFGPHVDGLVDCPSCGDSLELSFSTAGLRGPYPSECSPPALHADVHDLHDVRFRLPTMADLRDIAGLEPAEARRALLERCLTHRHHEGEPVALAELPPLLLNTIVERMDAADPHATSRLSLTCPSCHHTWQADFDAGLFFWHELSAWARRTLREVHALASAYGWSERDILGLGPRRRRLYLELVGS